MKGKIADSIIIKVGHEIMEIPRNKVQHHESDIYPYDKTNSKDLKATNHKVRYRI